MKLIKWVFGLLLFLVFTGTFTTTFAADNINNNDIAETSNNIHASSDDFSYSPMGRRDPFKPLVDKKEKIVEKITSRPEKIKGPLEKFELSQFRLMAIMIVKGAPRAMVKAPDGRSYTVKVNDYIGMNGGQVKFIQTKSVLIDNSGMRVEKSPDRIVVEEQGFDLLSGKETKQDRYIIM
jgi:Pilus assembly protein, PilP